MTERLTCPCCGSEIEGGNIPPEDAEKHAYIPPPRRAWHTPAEEIPSRDYSDKVIGPLAAWLKDHRGALAELELRFAKLTGRKVSRITLWRWLSPDPSKRVEPSFGNGIILTRLIRAMRSEYVNLIAPAGATGPIGKKLYPGGKPPKDGH